MTKALETIKFQALHTDKYVNHLENRLQKMTIDNENKDKQLAEFKRESIRNGVRKQEGKVHVMPVIREDSECSMAIAPMNNNMNFNIAKRQPSDNQR